MTSQEFKAIRIQLGLSQAELAKIMGLNQQNISRIEAERKPTRIQAAFIKYIRETKMKFYGTEEETIVKTDKGFFLIQSPNLQGEYEELKELPECFKELKPSLCSYMVIHSDII